MAFDGPALIRPVPRRPFDLNRTSPTPPDDESPPSPNPNQNKDFTTPQWLNAGLPSSSDLTSISRPASFLNLTSSTLFGIYSPTASSRDRVFGDREDNDTPWGTGAQTPIKRPNLDDATYELMRDRSHPPRRRSSYKQSEDATAAARARHTSTASTALSLGPRGALLFALGVGYGAVVTHFHSEQRQLGSFAEAIIQPGYNTKYLAFWGVSGVILGALLPWFDMVWEDTFGADVRDDDDEVAVIMSDPNSTRSKDQSPGTDWTLVMRAVGAFVGIAFAIRKVAWTSTLQVSATLALVNPLLWWLIDRSMPGFLLSTVVGLMGSAFLLGVNPEMMPAPPMSPFHNSSGRADGDELTLGGLASQHTVETGVWMLSVLFCSCVCFGNIGRRLAWSHSARGRWGGVR